MVTGFSQSERAPVLRLRKWPRGVVFGKKFQEDGPTPHVADTLHTRSTQDTGLSHSCLLYDLVIASSVNRPKATCDGGIGVPAIWVPFRLRVVPLQRIIGYCNLQ